jgi:hypothetical protein
MSSDIPSNLERARPRPPASNASLVKALWANCLVLLAILLLLLCRNAGPSIPAFTSAAYAQQLPIGGGAGVFIVPGQFSTNTYGCYIMDVDQQTLCAYQFYPGDKQLRLIAAREFRYDRKLKNFNSPNPSPQEVSQLLTNEQDDARVKEQNNTPASPEAAPKSQ